MSSCCVPSRPGPTGQPADNLPSDAGAQPSTRPPRLPWVDVPGGRFRMGYEGEMANVGDSEGPVREATVAPIHMSATTITNRQFAAFVKDTGHRTGAEAEGWSFVFHLLVKDRAAVRGRVAGAEWWWAIDGADWRHPRGPGSDLRGLDHHPVVQVSALDAEAYCEWAGTRLPTETEWEHAARGGLDDAIYPWGDEHPDYSRVRRCNIWEGDFPARHSRGATAIGTMAVTALHPNGYGLHHMVGNVWEWTADDWDESGRERVRRGGSYLCHDSYCNRYRVAARDHSDVSDATGNLGFRVVGDPHRTPERRRP